MPVRIITDSACDMTGAEHPALTVLPLSVIFGDTIYQDGVDLTHDLFYDLLVTSEYHPSTGQINPFAFGEAFKEAVAQGDEVVAITLSSKLSGTHQSALAAAGQVAGEIHVVDSMNVTVGQHVLVKYALRLVDEGLSASQIAGEIERVRDRVVLVGLLETLEYLRRGGRISNAAGTVGEMLSIKPLVTVENGEVCMLGKARGLKNGRKMVARVVEKSNVDFSMPIELGYSGTSNENLGRYLEESAEFWSSCPEPELPIHSVGATIGTHVGPGALALAFFKRA